MESKVIVGTSYRKCSVGCRLARSGSSSGFNFRGGRSYSSSSTPDAIGVSLALILSSSFLVETYLSFRVEAGMITRALVLFTDLSRLFGGSLDLPSGDESSPSLHSLLPSGVAVLLLLCALFRSHGIVSSFAGSANGLSLLFALFRSHGFSGSLSDCSEVALSKFDRFVGKVFTALSGYLTGFKGFVFLANLSSLVFHHSSNNFSVEALDSSDRLALEFSVTLGIK